jgi:hypothetical protein
MNNSMNQAMDDELLIRQMVERRAGPVREPGITPD